MADELENPSFANFSIESSAGLGDTKLLEDLLSPETSTANPDDIEKIPPPPAKKAATKTVAKKVEVEEEEEESKIKEDPKDKLIKDLLAEEEEEEEDTSKKKIVAKTTTEEEEEEGEDNTFQALSRDLLKLGVFSQDEGEEEIEVKTPEDFVERFNYEKKKGANEMVERFIGQFGEDYQAAFQAIYVNRVDPREYFSTYNNIQNFAEMDLSIEANQVAVVRQMLTDQGLEPEDITSELEQIKSYGNLEEKSQKYHKVLIKKEAQKLQALEQESQRKLQAEQNAKSQYINNVKTILQDKVKTKEFDGIPINPKLAGELHDFLLVDKWKTPSGETLSDFDKAILDLKKPEKHEQKVKLALLLKILEKDPNLSTIQKSGITKNTNVMFNELIKQKATGKSVNKAANSAAFSNL